MQTKLGLFLLIIAGYCFCDTIAHAVPVDRDYFTAHQDREALRDLGLNDLYHTSKVLGWIKEGRMDMAFADVKFTIDKWPNHPRALMLITLIAKLKQDENMPIFYFEKALKLYPQYSLTHAQYGKYLAEIGKINEGIARLKQAIRLKADFKVAHVWLAEAYALSGKKNLAIQSAEKAKELGYKGNFTWEQNDRSNQPTFHLE